MKKIILLPLVLCLAGCGVLMREPYYGTAKYNLAIPHTAKVEKGRESGRVTVNSFRNLTGAGRKMEFTGSDRKIQSMEYTEWAQSPERMIQCALAGALADYSWNVEINGVIWQFALDKTAKKAYLGVNYEIKAKTPLTAQSFSCSAPWESETGAAAAAAMDDCVQQLTDDIVKKLNNL